MLAALIVAVHARVPISALQEMIDAYPTFYRAIESALGDVLQGRVGGFHPIV